MMEDSDFTVISMVRCRALMFFVASVTSVVVVLVSMGIWHPSPRVKTTVNGYGMLQERMLIAQEVHVHGPPMVEQPVGPPMAEQPVSTADEDLTFALQHKILTDNTTQSTALFTADMQSEHVSPTSEAVEVITKTTSCRRRHCREYLSQREILALQECVFEVRRRYNGTIEDGNCSFTDGKNRLPVALVSTEGSGNTWVRGLLEKATGICTGFVYCDYMMRVHGFIGENIKSGSVLVVKTHTHWPQWYGERYNRPKRDEPHYGSAIFILRNPLDSLKAEWNRRATNRFLRKNNLPHEESHTNVVPRVYWAIPEWDKFLHKYMDYWHMRLKNWVINSTKEHPVHIVRYEDLANNTVGEVGRMLNFLNITYDKKELGEKLRKDFMLFKRKHNSDDFEHYSSKQKEYVKSVLLQAIELAHEMNKAEVLRLNDYLD